LDIVLAIIFDALSSLTAPVSGKQVGKRKSFLVR